MPRDADIIFDKMDHCYNFIVVNMIGSQKAMHLHNVLHFKPFSCLLFH